MVFAAIEIASTVSLSATVKGLVAKRSVTVWNVGLFLHCKNYWG
jgi:hypothetical protein